MTSLWMTGSPLPGGDGGLPEQVDVAVVGAGITGLSTAVMLARRGLSVAVLEARHPGAAATANTTAKITLLQGKILSGVRRHHGDRVTRAYVDGNRAGQAWLRDYMDEAGVAYQVRPAATYATTSEGVARLNDEFAACRAGGLPVTRNNGSGLPIEAAAAVELPDQLQVDPVQVLVSLLAALRAAGGRYLAPVRVTGVSADGNTVVTDAGRLRAGHIVLACGAPVIDRLLYFAKLSAHRSYALAVRTSGPLPHHMCLSVDRDVRSLRSAPWDGAELLLTGGAGHEVGRARSPLLHRRRLLEWTRRHWPDAEIVAQWSAQDYRSANLVPFVGPTPITFGHVHVATGYNKWGMTNGPAAALTISGRITGQEPSEWSKVLGRRLTTPRDLLAGISANLKTLGALTVAGSDMIRATSETPAEGQGVVSLHGRAPTATSTVSGRTCSVSGVCTHLGGIVRWNDAENSWDCPLHGSRFTSDGEVLEGMATSALKPI